MGVKVVGLLGQKTALLLVLLVVLVVVVMMTSALSTQSGTCVFN